MNTTAISVIMLTYNRENMLSKAIESILHQTYSNFEFIIVDNGSTDKSGEICDRYAKLDPRIVVIHRKAGNIGSGRNAGLDKAKGNYIAFIDDDDWVEPDFLEFLYNLAKDNNSDISICGYDKEENGKIITNCSDDGLSTMTPEEALITLMWRKNFNNGFPTKMFHNSLFSNLRFYESGTYDDIALMYKVLAASNKVSYNSSVKYHVIRHERNNSCMTTIDHLITPDYLKEYRFYYNERKDWLCNRFPEEKEYWNYFNYSFQISMVHKIVTANLTDCSKHLYEMREELKNHRDEFKGCPYTLDFEKEWMEKYV